MAHAYDATRGLPAEAGEYVADTVVKLAGATPETRFVEPGIGTGRIALPLVRRGYRYAGVDVSEKMLAELRRKLADAPEGAVGRLRLLQADATALPFEDASFDAAVSAHVLHLIPAWRRALAEVRRVLEPEGVFLYCHQEWDENGPRVSFSETWRAILASYGVDASVPGAGKTEVLRALREMNATLETCVAARWREAITVEEALGRYAERLYSTEWRLPDALFEAALGGLRSWAFGRYPSPDTVLNDAVTFEVTAARGWVDGSSEA